MMYDSYEEMGGYYDCEPCEYCQHFNCICDDDCGDMDDFDVDDYETVFDYEEGRLEVVR